MRKIISIAVAGLFLSSQLAWAEPCHLRPLATAQARTGSIIPPFAERLKKVGELMKECGVGTHLADEERREIENRLASDYFDVLVSASKLKVFLSAFKTLSRPVSKLELFLQEKILDYFLKESTEIITEVKDGTPDERQRIHELFRAGLQVYKFDLIRDRIKDRKNLLANFILLHIHLPEAGLGSALRGEVARELMIEEVLKSTDIAIFQPALEAVIETMALIELSARPELREILYLAFYRLLEETSEFPRFARALVDVWIKADDGQIQLLSLKKQEAFRDQARKIIKRLADKYPKLKKEFIDYLLSIPQRREEKTALVRSLLRNLGYQEPGPGKGSGTVLGGGGANKFKSVEVKSIEYIESEEPDSGPRKVKVRLKVKRLGQVKMEWISLYGTMRSPQQVIKSLNNFARTGIPLIDNAIERFLAENKISDDDPGIDDMIIEDAEFEEGSLLILEDIAITGIGLRELVEGGRLFRALEQGIGDDKLAGFNSLAHIAHEQGYLTLNEVLFCILDSQYKKEHYTEPINYIEILTGFEAAPQIKFYYALKALQGYIDSLAPKDIELARKIEGIGKKKPSRGRSDFLKDIQRLQADAVTCLTHGQKVRAAAGWIELHRRYFRLNDFAEAVRCLHRAASAYMLAARDFKEQRSFKDELKYLAKAVKLFQALDDKNRLMDCFGSLGLHYFRTNHYLKSAQAYLDAVSLGEELLKREENSYIRKKLKTTMAVNLARAALSYAKRNDYQEAGQCDQRSAEINVDLGETEVAVEHYIYAKINFGRAGTNEKARESEQAARSVDPGFFERVEMIESMLKGEDPHSEAVKNLIRLPEIMTLAGKRPATDNKVDIRVLEKMKQILKRYFKGRIGLVQLSVSIGSAPEGGIIRYCLYDKERIRKVVGENRDLFRGRLRNLETTQRLEELVFATMKGGSCRGILLGHPRGDIDDFLVYQRLLEKAGVPPENVELVNPTKPNSPLNDKLLSLYGRREKTLAFIESFYCAIQDYKEDKLGLSDNIGFCWPSVRRNMMTRYVHRYLGVAASLKLLIEKKPPEEVEAVIAVEYPDETKPGEARKQTLKEYQINIAIATQA